MFSRKAEDAMIPSLAPLRRWMDW
jgi:hypothetical protein